MLRWLSSPPESARRRTSIGPNRRVAPRRLSINEYLRALTEQFGGRLTGSPAYRHTAEWAGPQFRAAGVTNVRLEPFTIPNGWGRRVGSRPYCRVSIGGFTSSPSAGLLRRQSSSFLESGRRMELSVGMEGGLLLRAWRRHVARRVFSLDILLIFATRAVTMS